MITPDEQKLVRECLIQIASRCDGAHSQDFVNIQSLAFASFWNGRKHCEAVSLANKHKSKLSVVLQHRIASMHARIFTESPKQTQQNKIEWVGHSKNNHVDIEFELGNDIQNRLKPFQINGVKLDIAALQKNGYAIEASSMGVGKTYIAIAVCKYFKLKPIVLTPKSVTPDWEQAFHHFQIDGYVSNYEQYKLGNTPHCDIKAFENEKGEIKRYPQWQENLSSSAVIVWDEIHRAGGMDSQTSKLLIACKKQGMKILMLGATAADSPIGMKAIGFVLGLHNLKNFIPWCLGNGCKKTAFGLKFVGGEKFMKNLHRQIFPHKGNRIRKEDLGDAFPDNFIIPQAVNMGEDSPKIQEAYDLMFKELKKLEHQQMAARERKANQLVIMLRARQHAELLKIPTIAEMVRDAIQEGVSVAVFLNFNDSVDALAKLLNTKCFIRGGQSDIERRKAISDFQSNVEPVIICNEKAGGIGISLHDIHGGHPRQSIISPTFSSVDLLQCLGRIHRVGGKSKCIQKIIFAHGTIEMKALESVREKINRIDQLNDGDLAVGDLF